MPVQLLKIKDVAVLLQLTERTTADYIRKGLLPSLKIGGETRIHPEKLDAFLAKQAGLAVDDKPRRGRKRTDYSKSLLKQYPEIFSDKTIQ